MCTIKSLNVNWAILHGGMDETPSNSSKKLPFLPGNSDLLYDGNHEPCLNQFGFYVNLTFRLTNTFLKRICFFNHARWSCRAMKSKSIKSRYQQAKETMICFSIRRIVDFGRSVNKKNHQSYRFEFICRRDFRRTNYCLSEPDPGEYCIFD